VATRNACCRDVPHKFYSGDWDMLDIDFLKEEFFAALTSMHNVKSLVVDAHAYP
jgi:hypothetical protein